MNWLEENTKQRERVESLTLLGLRFVLKLTDMRGIPALREHKRRMVGNAVREISRDRELLLEPIKTLQRDLVRCIIAQATDYLEPMMGEIWRTIPMDQIRRATEPLDTRRKFILYMKGLGVKDDFLKEILNVSQSWVSTLHRDALHIFINAILLQWRTEIKNEERNGVMN